MKIANVNDLWIARNLSKQNPRDKRLEYLQDTLVGAPDMSYLEVSVEEL